MTHALIQQVEQSHLKAEVPQLAPGDTVDVHVRIVEGSKERIQIFNGVVIAMSGSGVTETVTVRRIVDNEGVERIFPLHSPKVSKIEVKRQGHVRRSKLYYLRDRVGKKRRLRDRRRGMGAIEAAAAESKAAAQAAREAAKAATAAEQAQPAQA